MSLAIKSKQTECHANSRPSEQTSLWFDILIGLKTCVSFGREQTKAYSMLACVIK